MLTDYFLLAVLSFRRNLILTILMVMVIGVGIGTSMTLYTVLRQVSSDPIPAKSSQLYVPQLDNWGPESPAANHLQDALTYRDAIALMRARQAARQVALYAIEASVIPPATSLRPFSTSGHAVSRDFFEMFAVPFREGQPWSESDDEARANVVVIGAKLGDKLFPRQEAIGQTINLDEREYRVVGVLGPWNPIPRFYDINIFSGLDEEGVFLPFSTAIDRQLPFQSNSCYDPQGTTAPGWEGQLNSECTWIKFWVELPTRAQARSYREFLHNYAAAQQRSGRFNWAPRVDMKGLPQWLVAQKVVPEELRASVLIAFAFLLVCLINSIGLMLAKFSSRAGELGIRRALGASKFDIFLQCMTEAAVIGAAGGLLGLGLTAVGLRLARVALGGFGGGLSGAEPEGVAAQLTHLDTTLVAMTLAVAVIATVCAGLYPTWRASRVQPALHLKSQ